MWCARSQGGESTARFREWSVVSNAAESASKRSIVFLIGFSSQKGVDDLVKGSSSNYGEDQTAAGE